MTETGKRGIFAAMKSAFLVIVLTFSLAVLSAFGMAPRSAYADRVQLTSSVFCSNQQTGATRIILNWFGLEDKVQEVWIDVSTAGDSFAPDTFTGYGPFDPNKRPITIEPGPTNATAYLRVNSLLEGSTWSTSQVFRAFLPNCGPPADKPLSPPATQRAAPAPEPIPVSLLGFSTQDVGLSEANITPDGGELKSCEPLMFYVYFKGSNATFTLTGRLEVRGNGRVMEVARTNGLFRGGANPMWRIGIRVLGGSAMPGLYTVKFTPNDGTGPYEGSINFTC